MKMAQFARFANNATEQILGVTGLQLENLQSMFSYPNAINVTIPKSVSGNVIYIYDGAPVNVKQATAYIKPLQAGSGIPSPDNVRSISGWTGANIVVCGKNLLNSNNATVTINGITFSVNGDGTVTTYGTATGTSVFRIYQTLSISHDLILSGCPFGGNYDSRYSILPCNVGGTLIASADVGQPNGVLIPASNVQNLGQIQIVIRNGINANGLVFKPMISIAGIPDLIYAPYSGEPKSYSITFPAEAGTVYGGALDVTTGVLSVRPFYASYAGETLAGPWVSSMDVYAPGVTPTIGAQVVDLGGVATTYQLAPTNVSLFNGINVIYADCGSMELEYFGIEGGGSPYV